MFTGLPARLFLVICALIPAHADVIYTNFGTGDAYSAGSGLIVTNDSFAWSSVALAFIPPASYHLASIELVASNLFAGDTGATLGIFADDNGRPGGKLLESYRLGELGQFGGAVPVLTVKSLLQPLLEANTVYWIGLNAPKNSLIIWNQNSTSSLGIASADGAGHWALSDSPQGALRINGDLAPVDPVIPDPVIPDPVIPEAMFYSAPNSAPVMVVYQSNPIEEIPAFVPEPASLWLFAGAMAVCLRRSRRFRLPVSANSPAQSN